MGDITDPVVAELLKNLSPLELLRVAKMPEAERLSGTSADTLKRKYPQWIVQISERRLGMRVGHALLIAQSGSAPATRRCLATGDSGMN
jgi:hypothetical protein